MQYLRILTKSAIKIQTFYRAYLAFMRYHYKKFSTDLIRGYCKMLRLSEQNVSVCYSKKNKKLFK